MFCIMMSKNMTFLAGKVLKIRRSAFFLGTRGIPSIPSALCPHPIEEAYSDQPFHSPAHFNVIYIAGIHFAYISCC